MSETWRPTRLAIAAGVAIFTLVAGECRAAFLDAHWVSLSQPLITGAGGEFAVTDYGTGNSVTGTTLAFRVFCLEYTEHFGIGTHYYVNDSTTNTAVKGGRDSGGSFGLNGTLSGDPAPSGQDRISYGTAWLFSHYLGDLGIGPFTASALSSIDLDPTAGTLNFTRTPAFDDAWSMAVQAVIWRLEDEVNNLYKANTGDSSGVISGTTKAWADSLYTYITTNVSGWQNDNVSGGHVTVMNIKTAAGGSDAQSQLAYNAGANRPDEPVPEPTTLVIWGGLGLLGLAVQQLRRGKPSVA